MFTSQTQVAVRNRNPVFPDFLLPGTFGRITSEAIPVRQFTPLMPQHISRRLIQNSFAEVMANYQLTDLSDFMTLLDYQYATSSLDPADHPARWAVVNAILALAVRVKTAPGSETVLADVSLALYRNAFKVVPELILQNPCWLSIQALLAMAIFARNTPDTQAFIMLSTNASRQLNLLGQRGLPSPQVFDIQKMEQYSQIYRTVNIFDTAVLEFLGTRAAVLQEGQTESHITVG
jgi:hypothetical protein